MRIPEGEPGSPDLSVPGDGYVIEVDRRGGVGIEKRRLRLSDGMVYHPGGIADDGAIPVRPGQRVPTGQ